MDTQRMQVEVVRIQPMRVASAWAFGPEPESAAWEKLQAWAGPLGLLDGQRRIFGFDNPGPSAGSPNYGYEYIIEIGPERAASGEIRIVGFAGGLYAVAPFADYDGDYGQSLPPAWGRLNAWVAASRHHSGPHQCLEQHAVTGKVVALYYPILE